MTLMTGAAAAAAVPVVFRAAVILPAAAACGAADAPGAFLFLLSDGKNCGAY